MYAEALRFYKGSQLIHFLMLINVILSLGFRANNNIGNKNGCPLENGIQGDCFLVHTSLSVGKKLYK